MKLIGTKFNQMLIVLLLKLVLADVDRKCDPLDDEQDHKNGRERERARRR